MRNTVTPRSVDAGMGMNDSAETNGSAKLSAAAAEARKPDSVTPHLNGGQEVRRSLGDDEQTRGGLAAALGQALHLLCVDGHHRKLCLMAKTRWSNEYDLQK